MPADVNKIFVGAISTLEISPYVAAKGAGTFQDVGFTLDGFTFEETTEYHETVVEQRLGIVKRTPKSRKFEIKTALAQGELENYRLALGIPTADLTGVDPNKTLKSNLSRPGQPYQVRVKFPGQGTTGVRTLLAWSMDIVVGAIPMVKDGEQKLPVTIMGREETTGSGTDSWNMVDA